MCLYSLLCNVQMMIVLFSKLIDRDGDMGGCMFGLCILGLNRVWHRFEADLLQVREGQDQQDQNRSKDHYVGHDGLWVVNIHQFKWYANYIGSLLA